MESGKIPDSQITASSEWDHLHGATNARLNSAKNSGSWSSRLNNQNQWLQVDFKFRATITDILTQGRGIKHNQWVRSYTVSYSDDGHRFKLYQRSGQDKVFAANVDVKSIVKNTLHPVIVARFIRINPKTWHGHISMRVEFIGCFKGQPCAAEPCLHEGNCDNVGGKVVCSCLAGYYGNRCEQKECKNAVRLGVEYGRVLDSQLSASSEWDANHGAENGRLNFKAQGRRQGAWSSKYNDGQQWIQVNFGLQATVTEILTQGRSNAYQWVKSYSVSYSKDGLNFFTYRVNGLVKVFGGNNNRNTIVRQSVSPVIVAQYIRIHPKTWYRHISMRVGFAGCLKDELIGIRLRRPSSSKRRGRVEIFHDERWGTVCDDNWDIKDARVVCRQLGYLNALNALQGSNTISGSGPIWLDEVFCAGSEHNLSSCSHRGWGNNDCSHSEDAGVECSFNDIDECSSNTHHCTSNSYCVNTHGSFSCECKKGYTRNNVTCVDLDECSTFDNCHQNAFCTNTIGSFHCTCYHGYTGNGTFCQDIDECLQSTNNCMANYNCTNTDGSYLCTCDNQHATNGSACVSTNVRLRGPSSSKGVGRVEVLHNGSWGTVCDTNWDLKDAKVVCRELGYLNAVRALQGGQVSRGSGQIWLNDVACTGNEQFLNSCSHHLAFRSNNCDHSKDAGVECSSTVARYNTYLIKSSSYGYLRRFGENHLHFSRHPGNHFRFIKENILQEANTGKCVHARNDLFVGLSYHCDGPTASRWRYDSFARHLKLVNKYPNYCVSPWRYYGKPGLEVSPGVSHVCNSWNRMALELDIDECSLKLDNCGNNSRCIDSPGAFSCVCLEGYSGNGLICNDIDECSLSTDNCLPNSSCVNTAGSYRCICDDREVGNGTSCKGKDIRLKGPSISNGTGRVEVFYNGEWGTVCDDNWDIKDANVACRQLGYLYAIKALQGGNIPSGSGRIWSDEVACTGSEQKLSSCGRHVRGWGVHDCSHEEDAGVECSSIDVDECLSGSYYCGTHAKCINTLGSYICQCETGYTGNGLICNDIDECFLSLDNCLAGSNCTNTDGSYFCSCDSGHYSNGSVCHAMSVRLQGPSSLNGSGLVEVFYDGLWGAVCGDGWDSNAAEVVCRELGYAHVLRAFRQKLQNVSSTMSFEKISCVGNEQNLTSCSHDGSVNNTCSHSEFAAVECLKDIDECSRDLDNCGDNSRCVNTVGSFECICNHGYTGDGVNCEDIDECHLLVDNCHESSTCSNLKGSYVCTCNSGFTGDGTVCQDLDECSLSSHNCHENSHCTNVNGSFLCTCVNGYTGNGIVCQDIDECLLPTNNNCQQNSKCTNFGGSFSCTCNDGYTGNGVVCEDINECVEQEVSCDSNADCLNTNGSYECRCKEGLTGDGYNCEAPAEKEILHRKSESPENKFFSFPNLAYIIVGLILLLGIILLVILIRRRRRRSYRPFPDNDNLELMLKDDFHPGIGDDNKNQGSPDSKAFISNDCGGLLDQDELNHATEC
ncbi:fibrillin-1-like isoform X4 [Dendronephthya gigantea]|nr:fibrillin-1-like isoform X4 [Dendronephthya gigantea]